MAKFFIEEERHTPRVVFDTQQNVFEIIGKSFPEDSKQFYKKITDWLDENFAELPNPLIFKINLYYLSSSSLISIKQVLSRLKEIQAKGKQVEVYWCYDEDDDDIKRTGEEYEKLTDLSFRFVINPS